MVKSLADLGAANKVKLKRYGIITAAILGVVAVSMIIGGLQQKRSENKRILDDKPDVTIFRDNKVTGIEQLAADLQMMRRRVEESNDAVNNARQLMEKQNQDMAELRRRLEEVEKTASQRPLDTPLGATPIDPQSAQVPTFKAGGKPDLTLKTPLPQPLVPGAAGAAGAAGGASGAPAPGTAPASTAAADAAQADKARSPEPERIIKIRATDAKGQEFDYQNERAKAKEEYERSFKEGKEQTVFMPAGSMFSAVLLTGVDMPTSMATQQNPVPVVFRVKREAILPNFASIDVRECFLLGSGYGQMSSERAILRAEALACVTGQGKVLETTFNAFVVGGDGKVGVPGRLVSKQGAMIARALLGGVFAGIAGQANPSPVPQLNINPGARQQWQNPDLGNIMENGVTSGFASAANSIARFYLKMAEETFPVIEISAGEAATIVVTQGASLPLKGSTRLEQVDSSGSALLKAAAGAKADKQTPALQPSEANKTPTSAPAALPGAPGGGAPAPAWQSGQTFGRPPEPQQNNPLSSIEGLVRGAVQRATAP